MIRFIVWRLDDLAHALLPAWYWRERHWELLERGAR